MCVSVFQEGASEGQGLAAASAAGGVSPVPRGAPPTGTHHQHQPCRPHSAPRLPRHQRVARNTWYARNSKDIF